jgi:hypothetical protein
MMLNGDKNSDQQKVSTSPALEATNIEDATCAIFFFVL